MEQKFDRENFGKCGTEKEAVLATKNEKQDKVYLGDQFFTLICC